MQLVQQAGAQRTMHKKLNLHHMLQTRRFALTLNSAPIFRNRVLRKPSSGWK
jgi:hypothetical protein